MNGIQLQMIYSLLEFHIRLSLTDFSVNHQSNTVGLPLYKFRKKRENFVLNHADIWRFAPI
jgi:hypothetical protein